MLVTFEGGDTLHRFSSWKRSRWNLQSESGHESPVTSRTRPPPPSVFPGVVGLSSGRSDGGRAAPSGQPSSFCLKSRGRERGPFYLLWAFLLLRFHSVRRQLHRRDLRCVLKDETGSLDVNRRNRQSHRACVWPSEDGRTLGPVSAGQASPGGKLLSALIRQAFTSLLGKNRS